MRILFASSEVYPLIKTGGLADVSCSLPKALADRGHMVRVVMPLYRSVRQKVLSMNCIYQGQVFGYVGEISVFETSMPGHDTVKVWLVDAPGLFDREGGPYTDAMSEEWEDNAYRFATLCRVIALMANNQLQLDWQPDVVHCNDWQTGLAIPLLKMERDHPASLFSIHNLAYQGNYSRAVFDELLLPEDWWSIDGVEFYGKCSFLKAGVNFADQITTVSPTYAEEIKTADFGEGFDGLLQHRSDRLTGILNGVDYSHWNPVKDACIKQNYDVDHLDAKAPNKAALQDDFQLSVDASVPLFGVICRLVYQKGIDLIIDILAEMLTQPIQIVILGSGDIYYEAALEKLQQQFPRKFGLKLGYDEELAHQIEAGTDFFLMPSRYEPCGLNQIYSLRYGTIPIVRNTGGLADTVIDLKDDLSGHGSNDESATGLVFEQPDLSSLQYVMARAMKLYQQPELFNKIRMNGMSRDFSWEQSSLQYEEAYERAIKLVNQEKMRGEK